MYMQTTWPYAVPTRHPKHDPDKPKPGPTKPAPRKFPPKDAPSPVRSNPPTNFPSTFTSPGGATPWRVISQLPTQAAVELVSNRSPSPAPSTVDRNAAIPPTRSPQGNLRLTTSPPTILSKSSSFPRTVHTRAPQALAPRSTAVPIPESAESDKAEAQPQFAGNSYSSSSSGGGGAGSGGDYSSSESSAVGGKANSTSTSSGDSASASSSSSVGSNGSSSSSSSSSSTGTTTSFSTSFSSKNFSSCSAICNCQSLHSPRNIFRGASTFPAAQADVHIAITDFRHSASKQLKEDDGEDGDNTLSISDSSRAGENKSSSNSTSFGGNTTSISISFGNSSSATSASSFNSTSSSTSSSGSSNSTSTSTKGGISTSCSCSCSNFSPAASQRTPEPTVLVTVFPSTGVHTATPNMPSAQPSKAQDSAAPYGRPDTNRWNASPDRNR